MPDRTKSNYEALVELGKDVDLPADPAELHRVALAAASTKEVGDA